MMLSPFASIFSIVMLLAVVNAACTGPPRRDGRCGSPRFGDARCSPGYCCSQYNWCGKTPAHCDPDICAESKATATKSAKTSSFPMPQPKKIQEGSKTKSKPTSKQRPPAAQASTSQQRGRVTTNAIDDPRPRVSISSMSPSELQQYRDAWARITAGNLKSIFQNIAQDHGTPKFYCPHGNQKFLPWHRHYIARVEEALGMPLAYWDWTQEGIPQAFSELRYVNSEGQTVANPLYSNWLPSGEATLRSPNMRPNRYRAVLAFAQSQDRFSDFTNTLESVHDSVHGAIGSTMSLVSLASYDPIFWAHHCFVDYQWWIWQLSHPDATYNSDARGTLVDSIGKFEGTSMIADQSGWFRGRSPDQIPRASASSAFSEPQLFLILKSVPAVHSSTDISVFVDDILLATDVRFGMQGMRHHIQKDHILFVESEDARRIWVEKRIELEHIPERATVWLTMKGRKISQLTGVTMNLEWLK